jgi:transposase InsO family protein
MDYHYHARLTVHGRRAMCVAVVEGGLSVCEAAAEYKLSRQTVSKWVFRYRSEGQGGLQDRRSRPHRSPRRVPEEVRQRVIELRRGRRAGWLIARQMGLSPATVSRILRSARLSRWRDLDPSPPVVRYEHQRPGDLLHLDIKGMTRFGEVVVRGDGRLRGKKEHPGVLALHVAVDDHSRVAFTRILADQKAETTISFLKDAVAFFARSNVQIRALLSDNGSAYRSHKFRAACAAMQIKHRRTKPYTPRTNGKAERFIQTALREWAYAAHWENSEQRDIQLAPWTDFYNQQRPHASLNLRPPISRLQMSTTS